MADKLTQEAKNPSERKKQGGGGCKEFLRDFQVKGLHPIIESSIVRYRPEKPEKLDLFFSSHIDA